MRHAKLTALSFAHDLSALLGRVGVVRRAALATTAAVLSGAVVVGWPAAALAADFAQQTGAANPFDGFDAGWESAPAFADTDHDGDLDAFVGTAAGTILYFENIGDPVNPSFVEQTGAANPFDGVDVGFLATPTFVDIDEDGDFDCFIGNQDGTIEFFGNIGSWFNPVFYHYTLSINPFYLVDVGSNSAPAFADIDHDGDFDAIVGVSPGNFIYFENTGDALSPSLVQRSGVDNPLAGVDVGSFAKPGLVDLDEDGDIDAVLGDDDGFLNLYENVGTAVAPIFVERTGTANPFDGVDVGSDGAPTFVDIDGDGDADAFVGEYDGAVLFFENTTALTPIAGFVEQTGAANPFDGVDVGGASAPTFVDIDGDGDADAFVGENDGGVLYYENVGDAVYPIFVERTTTENPLDGFDLGNGAAPAAVDLFDAEEFDVFVGAGLGVASGDVVHFDNTGTAISPSFVEQTGVWDPFDAVTFDNFAAPAFVDIDGDRDADLFVGENSGAIRFFELSWGGSVPDFAEQTGPANPFNGVDVGVTAAPTFVDLDGDGDADAFVGENNGTISYFQNTGNKLSPSFYELTGAANPFDGVDVGGWSKPVFVDIDMDGDMQAFVGAADGSIRYFENLDSIGALGDPCIGPGKCASGNCVDGVCCSTASCAECYACDVNGVGTCAVDALQEGLACDDGAFCNGTEICTSGVCGNSAFPPCDLPEYGYDNCATQCNETDDLCNANAASGEPCNDSTADACDAADSCDGSGNCVANYLDTSTSCDDWLYCNGADTCDGSGSCSVHAGDPCTEADDGDDDCSESCNESDDTCDANDADDSACPGGSCQSGVCVDFCTDGVLSGNETDIDCGGPDCDPCSTGDDCAVWSDCATRFCDSGTCASCADSTDCTPAAPDFPECEAGTCEAAGGAGGEGGGTAGTGGTGAAAGTGGTGAAAGSGGTAGAVPGPDADADSDDDSSCQCHMGRRPVSNGWLGLFLASAASAVRRRRRRRS